MEGLFSFYGPGAIPGKMGVHVQDTQLRDFGLFFFFQGVGLGGLLI